MIAIGIIIGIIVGGGVGVWLTTNTLRNKLLAKSQQVLKDAEEKGEMIKKDKILQAKEKFLQLKSEHDKQVNEKNSAIREQEQKLKQREQSLNQKVEDLQKKSNELKQVSENLNGQIEVLRKRQAEVEKVYNESIEKLEHIAGMTADEAKQHLIEMMTDEAKSEAASNIMDIVEEAKITANEQAKKIVIQSIQRTATENAIENTVSVFNLENEEVKGRIIGREGRNIRALESLTGVEIIIDDSPDAIIISGFDPVRREIARLSLHKLVTDGRIHPARIEEVVAKTRRQIEQEIAEVGKRTCIDLGINNMNHELMRMVGRMKYRSSYGQNLLQHSREVANLAATMASELGLNPKLAKRAGLLHDIGKVPETEIQRASRRLQRHRCSPRRNRNDQPHLTYHPGLRCHQRCPSRCPPRSGRGLHQPPQETGGHGHDLPRRGENLCYPGRSRTPRHRGCRQGERCRCYQTQLRPLPPNPERDDLPRPNQGYRHPRNPRRQLRKIIHY